MENEYVDIIFNITKKKLQYDLEVPLFITANELVNALCQAYDLSIDMSNMKECYLTSEEPIALLRGNKTLADYGIRNGSIINYIK